MPANSRWDLIQGLKGKGRIITFLLCVSFTVHAEMNHKSEKWLYEFCLQTFVQRERERDCARENRRVERDGRTLLRNVEEK